MVATRVTLGPSAAEQGGDCDCSGGSEFCVKRDTDSPGQLVLHLRQPLARAPQQAADMAEKASGHWEDLLLARSDEGFSSSVLLIQTKNSWRPPASASSQSLQD